MKKITGYKTTLSQLSNPEEYLLENSCLPGPRANLELLYAFIETARPGLTESILARQDNLRPVNSPEEFVLCCAVASCGKHLVNGLHQFLPDLQRYASDPRWRVRESAAMALQHIGIKNFPLLKEITMNWEHGNWYEQRALAAGLCEPAVLSCSDSCIHTLQVLETISRNIAEAAPSLDESFKTLVKAMCYCWSVAVTASPEEGKRKFENLAGWNNRHIRRIFTENLKKNRMKKMDAAWVSGLQQNVP